MLNALEQETIRSAADCFEHLSELERQAMMNGLERLFLDRKQTAALTAER